MIRTGIHEEGVWIVPTLDNVNYIVVSGMPLLYYPPAIL